MFKRNSLIIKNSIFKHDNGGTKRDIRMLKQ